MLRNGEIKRRHSMGMQLCKPERWGRSVCKDEEGERPSGSGAGTAAGQVPCPGPVLTKRILGTDALLK